MKYIQFNIIIDILNQFKELSGLTVNFRKTWFVPFDEKRFTNGELKQMDNLRFEIVHQFKLLGIKFDNKLHFQTPI